ncbi:MAG: rhomboid family intramembrane serine protease, partial [Chloroflexota bacterium]|nr:rhomboid family intramembrane serine protease [Chloroflexota bacterium]
YKIVGTSDYRPYVAFFVTVANVLAFIYVLTYAFLGGLALEEVYRHYALNICAVRAQPLAETLLDGARSIFLHMSFVHLTSNIIIFYVFGSRIEEHLGHLRFLAFYLMVGFGGHLGHLLLDGGQCGEALYMVGSSGAISGIIGAFLFLFPTARIKSKIIVLKVFGYDVNVPAWVYLVYWFFMQFFYQVGSVAPRINVHWGHVGGFITGLALIFLVSFVIAPPRIPRV